MRFLNAFILTFLNLYATVLCSDKQPCDLNDEVCVTKASHVVFKSLVGGNKKYGIDVFDPLHLDLIIAELPKSKLTLKDANLQGLKDCNVHKLSYHSNTWDFYLICPKLHITGYYVAEGSIFGTPINGEGKSDIVHLNKHIGLKGGYEVITGADGKEHHNITYVNIDLLDTKDRVIYNGTNIKDDQAKTDKIIKYYNDNWKKVNEETDLPIMQPFIYKMMSYINKFLAVTPKDELFYKSS